MTALLALLLLVQSPDPVDAAAAYQAGDYETAFALYREALDADDPRAGPLLYNLGNCAFRLGRDAEAAWFYRRALLRLPRDAAVHANLRLAEERLGLDPSTHESFGAAIESLLDTLTSRELLLLAAVTEAIGLAVLVFGRTRGARITAVVLVCLGLAGGARVGCCDHPFPRPRAIVLAREIALRDEPERELPATARLRAGEVVRTLEASDRWVHVVGARASGWAERAGLGLVD